MPGPFFCSSLRDDAKTGCCHVGFLLAEGLKSLSIACALGLLSLFRRLVCRQRAPVRAELSASTAEPLEKDKTSSDPLFRSILGSAERRRERKTHKEAMRLVCVHHGPFWGTRNTRAHDRTRARTWAQKLGNPAASKAFLCFACATWAGRDSSASKPSGRCRGDSE